MSSCVVEQTVNGKSIKLIGNDIKIELFVDGKKVYERWF